MNMEDLAVRLLPPEEKAEMDRAVQALAAGDYSGFYEGNRRIVNNMLSVENAGEFLDFAAENTLERECFCAGFLCAKGRGLQIGGYEEDLTRPLTEFFKKSAPACPEILELIGREKIYTDRDDEDNFKKFLLCANNILERRGLRAAVLEDGVYCGCQYTVFVPDKTLAERLISGWQSENFRVYF